MSFKRFYLLERDDLQHISRANAILGKFQQALLQNLDIFLTNFLNGSDTSLEKLKSIIIPFDKPIERLRLAFPKISSGEMKSASYSPASDKNNFLATIRVYSKEFRNYLDNIEEYIQENDKDAMKVLIRNFKAFVPKLLKDSSIIHEIVHTLDDNKFGITKATPKAEKVMELQRTIKTIEDPKLRDSLVKELQRTHINQVGEYNAEFLQALNDIVKDYVSRKLSLDYLKDYKNLEKEFWKNFIASKDSVTAENIKRIQKRLYSFYEVIKNS